MHIKAVVVIGDYETQANTINWYVTVGTNDDPFTNTKFPPTVSGTPTHIEQMGERSQDWRLGRHCVNLNSNWYY